MDELLESYRKLIAVQQELIKSLHAEVERLRNTQTVTLTGGFSLPATGQNLMTVNAPKPSENWEVVTITDIKPRKD